MCIVAILNLSSIDVCNCITVSITSICYQLIVKYLNFVAFTFVITEGLRNISLFGLFHI